MPVIIAFEHFDAVSAVKQITRDDELGDRDQELEPNRICFMYKSGDDLRQDSLVLDMIKVSLLYSNGSFYRIF
jgi:hypothetical protein